MGIEQGSLRDRHLLLRDRHLLLLGRLVDERLVDVRDDAAARDRRLDERVELLISADGELQVARRDALYLEVFARVTRELEHLGREVLKDGRGVNSRGRADALVRVNAPLQEAVDAADRELRARDRPDRAGRFDQPAGGGGDIGCGPLVVDMGTP